MDVAAVRPVVFARHVDRGAGETDAYLVAARLAATDHFRRPEKGPGRDRPTDAVADRRHAAIRTHADAGQSRPWSADAPRKPVCL